MQGVKSNMLLGIEIECFFSGVQNLADYLGLFFFI